MMHPLTYWVLHTVRANAPLTRRRLLELLPAMNPDRLDSRLGNLQTLGYVRRRLVQGMRDIHFEPTGLCPGNEPALQALLGTTPALDRPAAPAPAEPEATQDADDAPDGEATAATPPRPPVPVGAAALHNHWAATGQAWPQRPLVVRPGALDARRLSSVRFGRTHDCAERSLGVVEAGRRQTDPAQP